MPVNDMALLVFAGFAAAFAPLVLAAGLASIIRWFFRFLE